MSSLTAAGLPILSMVPEYRSIDPVAADEQLFSQFQHPASHYRPYVRWWWNGDRLGKTEILRELDILKKAGIGGMEINPIKFPGNADPVGISSLEWLSDEWIDMLEVALKGAKERGLVCDMIVGSGWPFGGEFLTREDQSQMMALGTKDLAGGQTHVFKRQDLLDAVNPDFHSKYANKLKALETLRLAPRQLSDVTQVADFSMQAGNDTITIAVPPGEHVLYYLVKITGFMAVINGAPGAGGPVLNHYSKPAVERYFKRMSDRLTARLGPLSNYFRAFFTDSLELEGANWCADMFVQFSQRKGYDLTPYFPFILFKVGEMGNAAKETYGSEITTALQQRINRVRYDFEDVRVALFKERFIDTFTGWCRQNGIQSRMQAYGRECNPLEAGMLIDIPECETWLSSSVGKEFSDQDYRVGRAYTLNNKYVSSAAHLAGKSVVSCEEMTNTGMVFNATLELIKIAGDQSILSGVTHSVLHGFNYSPPQAPFPGWVRYGTFFNERNTWWPFFKKWADYKTRIYALLQHGTMQADIALLPPLADLSAKFGFQRDPFPSFAYPGYLYQVWEAIHQNGNGCDYVTEHIIQKATCSNGKIEFGNRSYKTLLLVDVGSLLPETAAAINTFTSSGGKLICIETAPSGSPTNSRLQASGKTQPAVNLPGNVPVVAAPVGDFVKWYQQIQQQYQLTPFVKIANPDRFVSQVYYKAGNLDVFFFSNYNSQRAYTVQATFSISGKNRWVWDAETGRRYLAAPAAQNEAVTITLGPCESKIIVFDTAGNGDKQELPDLKNKTATAISSGWRLTLQPVEGSSRSLTIDQLQDLSKIETLASFAGTIVYETEFTAGAKKLPGYLQLGETHGVSEVELNGKKIGLQWYGRPLFDISKQVKPGVNQLRLRCTTTLGNYMKSLKSNKVAQEWTADQPLFPMGIIGPVTLV